MKTFITRLRGGALIALSTLPLVGYAQVTAPGSNTQPLDTAPQPTIGSFNDIVRILDRFLGWLFTIFIIIAAVFIVLAAFYYLTAGGEEEKIKNAKDRFIYAIVAIAVALVATGVQFVVRQLITGNST